MGYNCSCLRTKPKETEVLMCDANLIHSFRKNISLTNIYLNIVSSIQQRNPKTIKSIILIQSHIRGLLLRTRLSFHYIFSSSFLPSIDPDLPYSFIPNSLINDKEVRYVFQNYPALNDNIPVICMQTIQYENGIQYYGEWNQITNLKHGRGILKYPNGLSYYGQFRMNKASGKGKIIFQHNEEYEGDFIDNKANGLGIYKTKECRYEGKWKNDKPDGIGTETWLNGTCYTGEFKNGFKSGNGKLKSQEGVYIGNFLNNQLHGKGYYIWSDKREYKGDWKNNKIEGEGSFKWPDGRKYTGHYRNDKKDGYGIFEWPDGKKYKGYWLNGKQQGEGELYNPKDNNWEKGFWNNGERADKGDNCNVSLTTSAASKTIPSNNVSSNGMLKS